MGSIEYSLLTNKAYLFGGIHYAAGVGEYQKRLYEFSVDSGIWEEIPVGAQWPEERRYANTAFDDQKGTLYVHGGQCRNGGICPSFAAFSTSSRSWSVLPSFVPTNQGTLSYFRGDLFLFGGTDGTLNNNLNKFDVGSQVWTEMINSEGLPPEPRHSHSAVVYPDGLILFFGGWTGFFSDNAFYSYAPTLDRWREMTAPNRPGARYGHYAAWNGDSMFIFGGTGSAALNDLHSYRGDSGVWTEIEASGAPSARFFGASFCADGLFYVHGGAGGALIHSNDMYSYKDPDSGAKGIGEFKALLCIIVAVLGLHEGA